MSFGRSHLTVLAIRPIITLALVKVGASAYLSLNMPRSED